MILEAAQWCPPEERFWILVCESLKIENSPRQLAIAKGFVEANSVFLVTTSAKNIAEVIIS